MTGLADRSIAAITSRSVGSPSGHGLPNERMSAPASAPLPAPRSTTASTASSACACSSRARIAPGTPGLIAFTGALSMVMMPTAPSRSKLAPPIPSVPPSLLDNPVDSLWITCG